MPWIIEGKCVYKQVDGKKGELVKCHENETKAKAHMRALYANVQEGMAEFSMTIVKATSKDGDMRIRMTSSDIDKDYYDERMSLELFRNFITHINEGNVIPEVFRSRICEDSWCGGMPYVSLAHYKAGKNRVNVPGEILSIYIDGKVMKGTGRLFDNKLGRAVFKSLQNDLTTKSEDRVRISIGFLDTKHSHGDKFVFVRRSPEDKCPLCAQGVGDKIYKDGYLVHWALTRVPANPRTDIEVEKSMTTKREDAESIVQDSEVLSELELKSQAAEEMIVVKTADNDSDEKGGPCKEGDEECEKMHKEMSGDEKKSTAVETVVIPASAPVVAPVAPASPLDNAIEAFKSKVQELHQKGLTGEAALKELQAPFDGLGEVLRSEFTPKPTPEQAVAQNMETTLRSLLQEMLPQMIAQTVAPIQSSLDELRALQNVTQKSQAKQEEVVPQPRSLQLDLTKRNAIEQMTQKSVSSFARIANVSVGLPENYVRQA